jgi:hypothetical protein
VSVQPSFDLLTEFKIASTGGLEIARPLVCGPLLQGGRDNRFDLRRFAHDPFPCAAAWLHILECGVFRRFGFFSSKTKAAEYAALQNSDFNHNKYTMQNSPHENFGHATARDDDVLDVPKFSMDGRQNSRILANVATERGWRGVSEKEFVISLDLDRVYYRQGVLSPTRKGA